MSRGKIKKNIWQGVLQLLQGKFKRKFHLKLPTCLTIKYPSGTHILPDIKSTYKKLIEKENVSPEWGRWIFFITRWVPLRGKTIGQLLGEPFFKLDKEQWEEMQHGGVNAINTHTH